MTPLNSKLTCKSCGETKDIEHFERHKGRRNRFNTRCYECRAELEETKAERYRDTKRKWVAANKEHVVFTEENRRLLRTYGIDLAEYNRMFESQKGCCAMCGRHQSEFKKKLSVDHNHRTNQVRELLCGPCNQALGYIRENVKTAQKMIDYITKHT